MMDKVPWYRTDEFGHKAAQAVWEHAEAHGAGVNPACQLPFHIRNFITDPIVMKQHEKLMERWYWSLKISWMPQDQNVPPCIDVFGEEEE